MGESVLVFVSHSSEDKADLIEPIVDDLEASYINVWFDKKKIIPGDNLRKSIFKDGLDKADVVLIFFTEQSLQSSWVDKEIKHVLREEGKKGNNFDLNKIISIFDSKETYEAISDRYPELTDDLLHLMPKDYTKVDLGQLISAIWSKHLSLQGGDIETQRQLLAKDKEIFQKDKDIQDLKQNLQNEKSKVKSTPLNLEYQAIYDTGKVKHFIEMRETLLTKYDVVASSVANVAYALSFDFLQKTGQNVSLTKRGKDFIKWHTLNKVENSLQSI